MTERERKRKKRASSAIVTDDMTRPVEYSDELADRLCELIASTSRSVRSICDEEDWAPAERTFYRWVLQRDDFGQKYARAKETQAERFAEELIEIVDDGTNDWVERETQRGTFIALNTEAVARSRLRYDARRWLMSKMKPKKYGDKVEHEHSGDIGHAVTVYVPSNDRDPPAEGAAGKVPSDEG